MADLLGKLLVVLFENTAHVEIKSTGIAYEIVNLYVIVTGRSELIRLGYNSQRVEQVIGMHRFDNIPGRFGCAAVAGRQDGIEQIVNACLPENHFGLMAQQIVDISQQSHAPHVERIIGQYLLGIPYQSPTLFLAVIATAIQGVERRFIRRDPVRVVIVLERIAQIEMPIIVRRQGCVATEITLDKPRGSSRATYCPARPA